VKVEDVKIHSEVSPDPNSTGTVAHDFLGKIAVFGVAFAASLGLLPWLGSSMFADEGATLYSAHLSWANLWAQSQHVDLVLLPYYVLVHLWLMVSGSIQWVRALSLLAYFGTIVVVGWTGLRIAGRWCGIIAAVFAATGTLLVEKSLNARPYELSAFLVALCALMLFRWLDDSRTRWLWAFSALALLAAAMQLFSVLAPAAMLLSVLAVRPKLFARRLRVLLAPVALVAAVSATWFVICMRQVGQVNWIANESTQSRLLAEIRGPAIGQLYLFVLIVIVVFVVTKLAVMWSSGERSLVIDGVRRDRDVLALTIGWVILPTLILSIVSFAHPIYSVRYVSASAPGVALLVAFICVRTFPGVLGPARVRRRTTNGKLPTRITATVGAAVVILLVIGYVGSASALQEDLNSPAQYLARNAQAGDAIAVPDHALTSAIDYYLARDHRLLPLWPQLGVRQRYIEGFDLILHPSGSRPPRRVWLVADGSVSVTRFQRAVEQDGYLPRNYIQFNGSALLLYQSSLPDGTMRGPSSGATLSGASAVLDAAWRTNGVRITKVQFVLSGRSFSKRLIGTAALTRVGYYLAWNTTGVPNGIYSLQSRAIDEEGKTSYTPSVTIKVSN
jgi:4-amino-4-deoxy-L-arabinose transferase-like glycosyltransferase